ncbi:MAG: VOC family protein [Caulobacteraceae bacterium]|nr:VOC family protein [Caulobacteraceae bacterium]
MAIIPTVKSADVDRSIAFYTSMLDFQLAGRWPESGDPAFATLVRGSDELYLSSHAGDGVVGQAIVVLTSDVDALYAAFCRRGLDTSQKPASPVHQAPLDQTWGTREFYVDDPDGNTLRFTQPEPAASPP